MVMGYVMSYSRCSAVFLPHNIMLLCIAFIICMMFAETDVVLSRPLP